MMVDNFLYTNSMLLKNGNNKNKNKNDKKNNNDNNNVEKW